MNDTAAYGWQQRNASIRSRWPRREESCTNLRCIRGDRAVLDVLLSDLAAQIRAAQPGPDSQGATSWPSRDVDAAGGTRCSGPPPWQRSPNPSCLKTNSLFKSAKRYLRRSVASIQRTTPSGRCYRARIPARLSTVTLGRLKSKQRVSLVVVIGSSAPAFAQWDDPPQDGNGQPDDAGHNHGGQVAYHVGDHEVRG
jgi:hypothetical protein